MLAKPLRTGCKAPEQLPSCRADPLLLLLPRLRLLLPSALPSCLPSSSPRLRQLDLRAPAECLKPVLPSLAEHSCLTSLSLDLYSASEEELMVTVVAPPRLESLFVSSDRSRWGRELGGGGVGSWGQGLVAAVASRGRGFVGSNPQQTVTQSPNRRREEGSIGTSVAFWVQFSMRRHLVAHDSSTHILALYRFVTHACKPPPLAPQVGRRDRHPPQRPPALPAHAAVLDRAESGAAGGAARTQPAARAAIGGPARGWG